MTLNSIIRTTLLFVVSVTLLACNNTPTTKEDSKTAGKEPLSIKRIYEDKEFESERIGQIRWLKDSSGY
ncbi:MAG: hypothetical protein P8H39_02380, partial [Thalassotalea sp.]|nr:hypothetical protein [Thalassotalea sp.]